MADNFVRRLLARRVSTYVSAYVLACMSLPWLSFALPISAHAQHVATTPAERDASRAIHVTVDADNVTLSRMLQLIAAQAGLNCWYDDATLPANARVTLHVRHVPIQDAFGTVLRGTGLVARIRASGDVAIVPAGRGENPTADGGVVAGRVTNAKDHRPLRGAQITIDGMDRPVMTGEDGSYRFVNVHPGSRTVTVRLLGYGRAVHRVTVQDNITVSLDVALDPSVNALDQVVVTGTVAATAQRAIPNAITVVTAKDIEERGITQVQQLFRGDVPGLFAPNLGSNSLNDSVVVYARGSTVIRGTTGYKTYVDGVELANPVFISQIDPRSIERIEIVTGPQATTIYGSNALNGVMQIFTKRGGSGPRPQYTVSARSGLVQNNFNPALAPQHEATAQVAGTEGRLSYNGGGTWSSIGRWQPAIQRAVVGGYGGVRLQAEPVSVDASFRQQLSRNDQHDGQSQGVTQKSQEGLNIRQPPALARQR